MDILGKIFRFLTSNKTMLGIVIGMLISLVLVHIYNSYILTDCRHLNYQKVGIIKANKADTALVTVSSSLNDLLTQDKNFEERFISMNKRIDDFYIFFGIQITILIGINIFTFVNAERMVEKYFKDNFQHHEDRLKNIVADAETNLSQIKSHVELSYKLLIQAQKMNTQKDPPIEGVITTDTPDTTK